MLSSGGSCDVSNFDATMLAKIAEHVEALRARYAEVAEGAGQAAQEASA